VHQYAQDTFSIFVRPPNAYVGAYVLFGFFPAQNNSHDCVHMDLPLTAGDLKAINLNKAAPILQVLVIVTFSFI
jgi:hypothetical protein